MKITGNGTIINLDKCPNAKCRHWRLRVKTTQGIKTRRFTGTQAKARKALEDFKEELSTSSSEITFAECADRWSYRRKHLYNLAEQTLTKEAQLIRRLNEHFGELKIGEITRSRALDGFVSMKEEQGFSGTYLNSLFSVFKAILNEAVEEGDINKNPLNGVKAPKIDTKPRRSLTFDELSRLINGLMALPLDSYVVAILLIVMTGTRRGEALAFRWSDIKKIHGHTIIEVKRSVTEKLAIKEPKTPAGYREIPIGAPLASILANWKHIQRNKLLTIGVEQGGDTYICASEVGGLINPQNLDRWWRKHRETYGLGDVVIHEMRHTFFTILGNYGANSAVLTSIAGWSSIQEGDRYIHDNLAAKAQAVNDIMASVFAPNLLSPGGTSGGTSSGTSNDA